METIAHSCTFRIFNLTAAGRSDRKFDAGIIEDPYVHGYKSGTRGLEENPPQAVIEEFKRRWRKGYRDAIKTRSTCDNVRFVRILGTWVYPNNRRRLQNEVGEDH